MAGEWLKFDCTLPEKQETLAITAAMGWDDPDTTVGKLMRLFRWFDQQTVDGNAPSVTPALLDRVMGVSGFVSAVVSVGWIVVDERGLSLSNFDRHNGATAKSRVLTSKRVANYKANGKGNAEGNADSVSGPLPRVEKSREEKNINTPPSVVARATRKCPTNFLITEEMQTWAATECPTVDVDKATAKFADHTFKTAMTDWPATWRNWLRSDQERAAKNSTLPAWREQQRIETRKAAPTIALGSVNPNTFFTELGASNVTALKLG